MHVHIQLHNYNVLDTTVCPLRGYILLWVEQKEKIQRLILMTHDNLLLFFFMNKRQLLPYQLDV